MRRRAGFLLASLAAAGSLAACVPPAPLAVAGVLPPAATSYAIVGEDELPAAARTALTQGLSARGLALATGSMAPDRLVSLTLADRPRVSGTVAGTTLPKSRSAEGWTDRPVRDGLFSRGRREVRLTIRFLTPDGRLREERVAQEVVTRNAPAANMARLVTAALRP